MNKHKLYTIGYSSHTIQSMVNSLKMYNIGAIADVRTQPFSKFKPEFNRPIIAEELKKYGIKYVFLGEECGARINEQSCYTNSKADFSKISINPIFLKGLDRILKGLANLNIVLLCAEKDPIMCHRTILVCRNLRNRVVEINHILSDNTIETQSQVEKRLLQRHKLYTPDIFKTESQRIEEAYVLQSNEIAYSLITDENQENLQND